MSLVFQMAPGYREVYKKYIMLSKGLALGEGIYQKMKLIFPNGQEIKYAVPTMK